MYLPMISGYELGQFLRILMWIFVPVAILSMLVTTWLHYRRRRREAGEVFLSMEALNPGDGGEEVFIPVRVSGKAGGSEKDVEEEDQEYKDTVYKGILWMKEKYEQYRDMSDQRYERLKDELAKSEKKNEELLASILEVKVGDHREKLLSGSAHTMVEERASGEEHAETEPVVVIQQPRPVPIGPDPAAEVERDSLRDLLAERNQQIVFLQRQLDQRIKDFHMAEHEGRATREQVMELQEQSARSRQRLEEEVDRIRHQLEDEIARGRRQLEEQVAESKQQLDEQGAVSERKLEEKQRMIVELEEQQHVYRQRIDELVEKLRNNTQLLLNIYQELDKSFRTTDTAPQP